MPYEYYFAGISVFLGFIAYVSYVKSILKGQSKPHIYSWVNWTIILLVGGFAQNHVDEGGLSSIMLYFSAFSCFTIAVAAYFVGTKNITKTDTYMFAGALVAIPVWLTTKNPLNALVILMAIDTMSFYPTFRKTYKKPFSEDLPAFVLTTLSYGFSALAITEMTWQNLMYPVYLTALEGGFVVYLLWRRKVKPLQTEAVTQPLYKLT